MAVSGTWLRSSAVIFLDQMAFGTMPKMVPPSERIVDAVIGVTRMAKGAEKCFYLREALRSSRSIRSRRFSMSLMRRSTELKDVGVV